MKKQKKDPIAHEQSYILYLEKQIEFFKKDTENNKDKLKDLNYSLSKARLVLRLLTQKK